MFKPGFGGSKTPFRVDSQPHLAAVGSSLHGFGPGFDSDSRFGCFVLVVFQSVFYGKPSVQLPRFGSKWLGLVWIWIWFWVPGS